MQFVGCGLGEAGAGFGPFTPMDRTGQIWAGPSFGQAQREEKEGWWWKWWKWTDVPLGCMARMRMKQRGCGGAAPTKKKM
jgi:hypothetical protein